MDTYNNPVACEYRRRNPRGHWFDDDTIRFFGTRMGRVLIGDDYESGNWYFITSEKPPHGPRRYSVRVMYGEGDIETIGAFCTLTRSAANRLLERAHANGTTGKAHKYGARMLEMFDKGDMTNARYWAKAAGLRLNLDREGGISSITADGRKMTREQFADWAMVDVADL